VASQVVTATANPIPVARWIGDDWQFQVAYQNPDGSPFDLSGFSGGANIFNHNDNPIELISGIGEVEILSPHSNGMVYVVFFKEGTTVDAGIKADANIKAAGGTRLQVFVVDSQGLKTTILVQPIWVRQE
jgi:hypothetical protein